MLYSNPIGRNILILTSSKDEINIILFAYLTKTTEFRFLKKSDKKCS